MAAGPLARLAAQVITMTFGIVSRAFVQAYQQAAANPNAAKNAAKNAQRTVRNAMSKDEALKVLNFEKQPLTMEELGSRYTRFFNANDPQKGGSFYLQSKFHRAKEALEADMPKEEGTSSASTEAPGGAETPSSSADDAKK